MVVGKISDAERYFYLHPLFRKLFDFVIQNNLANFSTERIVLDGDDLFINMAETDLKKAEDQKLEVHREYIDVHFPLTAAETCGVTHLSDLTVDSDEPFSETGDYAVYSEKARTYFTVHPGDFYIVFPEDAHAPIIGEGKIKKAIAKVKINPSLPF